MATENESPSPLEREPVIIILGAASGVVSLGLVAAKSLGLVDLDSTQIAAIVAFIAAIAAMLAAAIRGQVSPVATIPAAVTVAPEAEAVTVAPDAMTVTVEPDAIVEPDPTLEPDPVVVQRQVTKPRQKGTPRL